MLTHERLRALYAAFLEHGLPGWSVWERDSLADLTWAAGLDAEALRRRETQDRLWKLKGLGTAGPSESLSVQGALEDPQVVELIAALARDTWSPDPDRRASELQAHYDKTCLRVRQVVSGNAPNARLKRVILALRPGDAHCGLSSKSSRDIRDLLLGDRGLGKVEAAVRARVTLRKALGMEADLREHARRSMFCWWLHEHRVAIDQGETPGATAVVVPEGSTPQVGGEEADSSPLTLWTIERQHRWPQVFKGGLRTVRMPLRECLQARSFEDLQGAVRDDLGAEFASEGYLRRLLRTLRNFGLLDEVDGRYRTTDAGEETLQEDPPAPLIEALIVRVVGFATVLRALKAGPQASEQLSPAVAVFVHGDGGKDLWGRLVTWGQNAGLIHKLKGHRYGLTEEGRRWAARLPGELPAPDWLDEDEDEDEGPELLDEAPEHPTFAALWQRFNTVVRGAGYIFSRDQVRSLHAAWTFHARKRFAILSGLSGTGKTKLLEHYAEQVCALMDLDPKRHLALVPVRPDWRDPTGLLGYYNALHATPTFQIEPALQLVLRAARDPKRPYFLILDEMNLARVERYFAPFLSTMETGRDLQLHAELEPINGVPPRVPWPANLRIGGTVNMDETTHPFSDKVLDRAFTLEFWEVRLAEFMQARTDRVPADEPVEQALLALQTELVPIRRHVGYRSAAEVLGWVAASREADPEASLAAILDQAIFAKVLPRLRGTESTALTDALNSLLAVCAAHGLKRCAGKLSAMKARLLDTGVTSFWS